MFPYHTMANQLAALFLRTLLTTFFKWKHFKVLYPYNPGIIGIKHSNICLKHHKTCRVKAEFPS